jgi:glycosyltransferase involved in cell wall biosynthesis
VDDFAAARNASIAHCSGDWILALDADEAIDPMDHAALRQKLAEGESQAFRICMRNYVLSASQTILDVLPVRNDSPYLVGREFTHYVDYLINARIFRRFPDVRFSGRVHEVVDPYFESRGLSVGVAPAILHHFGKLDEDRQTYKNDFYLRLCEKDAEGDTRDFRSLFNLMMQYRAAGKWAPCLEAAEGFMQIQKKAPVTVLLTASTCHRNLGNLDAALHYFERALTVEPEHAGALAEKGLCLILMGNPREACAF